MRALVQFTLQRKLHTNMCRTQLLGYSPQPGCPGRPVGCISGGSIFMTWHLLADTLQEIRAQYSQANKALAIVHVLRFDILIYLHIFCLIAAK